MQDFQKFKKIIWNYYKKYGRNTLPWRKTKDPYKILVSEYMLQQTQVGRVIPKYEAFIKEFPNFKSLAKASVPKVLKAWQGLGYNRRALYLKRTAEIITDEFKGILPKDPSILVDFPGIGANTAAAICVYSFNLPIAFIETNIRRIFIYFFFNKQNKISDTEILKYVHKTINAQNPREWYWALMDYGTYLKGQVENPNRKSKHYIKQSGFEGSDRQIRGKILRLLLEKSPISQKKLYGEIKETPERIKKILKILTYEGFIEESKNKFLLKK